MKIYRNRRALGVNTGVANCIKADLNVLVDTGMNWPRSLVRTNRDDARTKWYLDQLRLAMRVRCPLRSSLHEAHRGQLALLRPPSSTNLSGARRFVLPPRHYSPFRVRARQSSCCLATSAAECHVIAASDGCVPPYVR